MENPLALDISVTRQIYPYPGCSPAEPVSVSFDGVNVRTIFKFTHLVFNGQNPLKTSGR